MIAVGLRFLAGQYHATPWGRHVNEGIPEWPPSPWRLVRALIAVWKLRHPHLHTSAVQQALRFLASPPKYHLPRASLGQTRHYMQRRKGRKDEAALIFDSFVSVKPDEELVFFWPEAEASNADRQILDVLLRSITYFGRAESWCEARLLAETEARQLLVADGFVNSFPVENGQVSPNYETVRVLCPDPVTAFASDGVQPKTKGRRKATKHPPYDPPWNICIYTDHMQAEGWSDPPGSRWVTYARPLDCLEPVRRWHPPRRKGQRPQVARFALDSPVLPLLTEALHLAEHVRNALVGLHRRLANALGSTPHSAVLSGKDEQGNKLLGHQHAYYLPTDEDGDGRLDHVTVVAEAGFDDAELRALDQLRVLSRGTELPELRLLLLALDPLNTAHCPLTGPAQQWVSMTPFLATRHPKRNGRKRDAAFLLENPHAFLVQVLREELQRLIQRRGWSFSVDDVEIHPLYDPPGVFRIAPQQWRRGATGPRLRPLQFKRFRQQRSDDGGRRRTGAFRLTFPQPVRGPIALGHSAHFGLGLFLPASPP